jgi:hypothetical protein
MASAICEAQNTTSKHLKRRINFSKEGFIPSNPLLYPDLFIIQDQRFLLHLDSATFRDGRVHSNADLELCGNKWGPGKRIHFAAC